MSALQLPWRRLRSGLDRFLFRVGDPEPIPMVLGQRRIFVLPTVAGLTLTVALLVMLVASINYSLSLGYAMVFLIGGIAVSSIVHAFRNLLGLSIRPGRARPVFAGEPAVYHLLISNPVQRRRPALRALPGSGSNFELGPDTTKEIALTLPTTVRGWLPLGRITLETTYPLGLIRAWSVLRPDLRCLVYPAPETHPPRLPQPEAGSGGTLSGRDGDDDFAGLRDHDPADSPRHVAWRVVARGGPMLTKRFTGQGGGEIELNWFDLPSTLDSEQKLSRLTAWVLAADEAQLAYGLRLPDRFIEISAGSRHQQACLTALALFGKERHGSD